MTRKILLTRSEDLFSTLEKKQQEQCYLTIQELINEIVRRSLFGVTMKVTQGNSQNQGGRPKKFEFEDYFAGPPGSAIKNGSIFMRQKRA